MKKLFGRTLAITLVVMMIACSTAFAATLATEKSADGKNLTVKVTELTVGEESTLLAVKTAKAATLAEVANNTDAIFYIDQATAEDGTATYSFDIEGAGDLTIYSGYATMGENAPLSEAVKEKEEPGPGPGTDPKPGVDFNYGDVNNDKDIDAIDAGAIISYFLNGSKFIEKSTGEEFAYGKLAANVTKGDTDIDAIDAGAVIANFLNGAKFPITEE